MLLGYAVSNFGNVKSLEKKKRHVSRNNGKERMLTLKEKILKPSKDALGYVHVRLRVNGKYLLKKVHILVAEMFLGYTSAFKGNNRRPDTLVVQHIDHDKINNKLENLRIVQFRKVLQDYWEYKRSQKA